MDLKKHLQVRVKFGSNGKLKNKPIFVRYLMCEQNKT